MRWDLIQGIKYRLEHPEEIPGKSWFTVYREDVKLLLQLLEENENERRKEDNRRRSTTFERPY